jgi:glycerophosphoryl diester phosphodiesterase
MPAALHRRPELVAHRGAPREIRENTLPSFLRAVERGADSVELDVHALADGTIVVHHDPILGPDVAEPAWAGRPLTALRHADLEQAAFRDGTRIPTLADVFDALPASVTVYVEVKGAHIEELVAQVVAPHAARAAVHSFDHRIPRRVTALVPGLPAGILVASYLIDSVSVLAQSAARDLWPHFEMIDADLVHDVHGAGGRVIAWTANDPEVLRRLAYWGVDALCTDDVRVAQAALGADA